MIQTGICEICGKVAMVRRVTFYDSATGKILNERILACLSCIRRGPSVKMESV